MINTLLNALVISMGINIMMFVPAYLFSTDKLTDISYAATFVVVSFFGLSLSNNSAAHIILFLMVILWAARLGMYLFVRIKKIGKDKRFDQMRKNFIKFGGFWVLQGFTVWTVLFPVTLFFAINNPSLTFLSLIGFLIFVTGLLIETIADYQKYRFINNPKNKGKWINTGLWKHSRHPNYFGEILLWIGVYVFTLSNFELTQALIGLIGPIYIAFLIIFVSGIPLLEKKADKRWGKNKNYQEYKKSISTLIPLPERK